MHAETMLLPMLQCNTTLGEKLVSWLKMKPNMQMDKKHDLGWQWMTMHYCTVLYINARQNHVVTYVAV